MALIHSFSQSCTHEFTQQIFMMPAICQALFYIRGHGPFPMQKKKEKYNCLFLLEICVFHNVKNTFVAPEFCVQEGLRGGHFGGKE